MTACDGGLVYAPEGRHCVAFHTKFAPDEILTKDMIGTFVASLEESINSGDLYQCVRKKYPDTLVSGLGSPGDGRSKPSLNESNEVTDTKENSDGSGISAGGIVGILLVLVMPFVYIRLCKDMNDSGDQKEINIRDKQQDLEVSPQTSAQPLGPEMGKELSSTTEGGEISKSDTDELERKDDDSSSAQSSVSASYIGDVNEKSITEDCLLLAMSH